MNRPAARPPAATAAPFAAPVFVGAIFLSAALLFSIQPLVARMALPRLGGAPAVWTTAMLFFQAALLIGYAYAHLLATRLALRTQAFVQGALLVAGAFFLPIALPELWQLDHDRPVSLQVLALFAGAVGLPFLALSANAPLLQRWYAASGRPDAHDPYFLYAASNVGSVAALLAYPLVLEPLLGTGSIGLGWAAGYLLFGLAFLACALAVPAGHARAPARRAARIPAARWLRWVGLAFLPSSMMLSTTQIIATDIGSFPLLWVIPLSLYLLSFVAAFSRRLALPRRALGIVFALAVAGTVVVLAMNMLDEMRWWGFALVLVAFTAIALHCHVRLYDDRPEAPSLTAFYLALSAGGVLGGAFNALVAPVLFDELLEAPIVLVLAGLALTGPVRPRRDILVGAGLAAAYLAIQHLIGLTGVTQRTGLVLISLLGFLMLLASRSRPMQFAALACGMLATGYLAARENLVQRNRSFFGIYTVRDHPAQNLRELRHGTTTHGVQFLTDLHRRPEALSSYYHRNGPIGQVIGGAGPDARIGILGLGTGALSCYARPGQEWVFYEIDPLVNRIARNPILFSYMHRCGREIPTVIGDARVTIEQDSDRRFDILLMDAFTSDAIPIHLLTLEALRLYRDRLAPGGTLLVHISNRYFDLAPVLGRAAAALGLNAAIRRRTAAEDPPFAPGEQEVDAVIMTEGALPADPRWQPLADDGGRPWTDDHASLLGVLRRGR